MRFGFVLPSGTATEQLELAELADARGWDGVFSYEVGFGVDPWTLLAAMSQRTRHVRLGTILTPLPWRRPWKLASQVATLDQVSGGRAILAVGLGATDPELGSMGEETDRRLRAEKLDEGIDLMRGLWEGRLRYAGQHYDVDFEKRPEVVQTTRPVQKRIPIWVVGVFPRPKSMRRVLRCDGILPAIDDNGYRPTRPEDIGAVRAWLSEHGGVGADFDIISEGETPADDAAAAAQQVRPWAEAGCSWWLEERWMEPSDPLEKLRVVRQRIEAGPPRS